MKTASFLSHKTVLIALGSVLFLSALTWAANMKNHSQRQRNLDHDGISNLMRQVDQFPDQSLRVAGNDDCPVKIAGATVKEIPGSLFTSITGRATDLAMISSVPEVTLVNASEQTVTTFYLAVRDPNSRTTYGIIQSKIAIKPGESYIVKREDFARSERMSVVEQGQTVQERIVDPRLSSEKRWIDFAPRSDVFVTIAKVDFENGESWTIKEGGDVK